MCAGVQRVQRLGDVEPGYFLEEFVVLAELNIQRAEFSEVGQYKLMSTDGNEGAGAFAAAVYEEREMFVAILQASREAKSRIRGAAPRCQQENYI